MRINKRISHLICAMFGPKISKSCTAIRRRILLRIQWCHKKSAFHITFLSYGPDKFSKVLKMCPKIFNQKSYTEVQIRLSLHANMQIFSPSTIKLWPEHRLRRKNINNNNNKGSKIRTGPLLVVGTIKMKSRPPSLFPIQCR